jgi:hypothetical protein
MIHYHGTPFGGKRSDVIQFAAGRHLLIPWISNDRSRSKDIAAAGAVSSSFVIDNSAFTLWKQGGGVMDVEAYVRFTELWCRHPAFDWALIPDVIEGAEEENDAMISQWPSDIKGVPVWHLDESLDRLVHLCGTWEVVALGSAGEYSKPGQEKWWRRMGEAMSACCDSDGHPLCKLHGLRMMSPAIFTKLPLKSADSTNAAQNCSNPARTKFDIYRTLTRPQRGALIADRIESQQSAPIWNPVWAKEDQLELW